MESEALQPWALQAVADAALGRAADELRVILRELASRLRPFPAFIDGSSIQALEVEPQAFQAKARGCVVVCSDGELYELTLHAIPGPLGVAEADQVGEVEALELPPAEYVPYAYAAILALTDRLSSS